MKKHTVRFFVAAVMACAGACEIGDDELEAELTDDQPYASLIYMGCYTDEGNRALPAHLAESTTVDGCALLARSHGYRYAGLQWYGECWGGNELRYNRVSDGECNTPCTNNPSQTCGGAWRNSVYEVGAAAPRPFGYEGCFTDAPTRALPVLLSTNATPEECIAGARHYGYRYAGLQYYGQCFAGNNLGYTRVSDSQCNTPCNRNRDQICGGAWRNSIFRTQ